MRHLLVLLAAAGVVTGVHELLAGVAEAHGELLARRTITGGAAEIARALRPGRLLALGAADGVAVGALSLLGARLGARVQPLLLDLGGLAN